MKRLLFALALVAATAVPALADPTADLSHAMQNLGRATSYHIQFTAKGMSLDIDAMPPQKMHMTGGPMEVVKIDNDTYVKMGETWRKFNIPGIEQMTGMYKTTIDAASHPTADMIVTDLGPKVVDGVPLHGYTWTDKEHPKASATFYLDGGGNISRIQPTEGGVIRITKINAPMTIVAPI
jgi:hypothetical protein